MATTKGKESSLGKEKMLKAPSNSTTTHTVHTRTLRSTLTTVPTDQKASSTTSEKQVPNYLKPTISSSHESFKQLKKNSPEDSKLKPILNRRRSFDKPPSASRLKGAFFSPGPRERTTPRSSSFSAKTTSNLGKSSPDKISRTTTPLAKSSLDKVSKTATSSLKPSNVKKGMNPSTKKDQSDLSSMKVSESVDISLTLNVDTEQQHVEIKPLLHMVEEVAEVECELPEPPEMPTSGETIKVFHDADNVSNNDGCEEIQTTEISAVSEDVKQNTLMGENEEAEYILHGEESKDAREGEDKPKEDESNEGNCNQDVGSGGEAVVEATEAEVVALVNNENTKNEDKMSNEKEGDDNEQGKGLPMKGEEGKQNNVEEPKPQPQAETVASRKHHGGQGRKDQSPAYNDVIEETASKLMEKRKNKVKALVGAFETVIDYEATSK